MEPMSAAALAAAMAFREAIISKDNEKVLQKYEAYANANTTSANTTSTNVKMAKATSCTAIIIHPTHSKGILSSIMPTLKSVRQIVQAHLPNGPRIINLKQNTHNPTNVGVLLWRSGIALGAYIGKELHEKRLDFTNKRVIELGCGCAPIASIVAGEYGASQSLATDNDEEVLKLATYNVRKNSIGVGVPVQVERFDWGDENQIKSLLGEEENKESTSFNVILAADVIYWEGAHKVLCESLLKLGDETTIMFIAYQLRMFAYEGTFFKDMLPAYGIESEIVWTGDEHRVQIVKCKRRKCNV